jgi:hypothetical protein
MVIGATITIVKVLLVFVFSLRTFVGFETTIAHFFFPYAWLLLLHVFLLVFWMGPSYLTCPYLLFLLT